MKKKILISGGSGLLGSRLTELLQQSGMEVTHLSRHPAGNEPVRTYRWNVKSGWIDPSAMEGVDAIVHLAGASVAGKRWTEQQKKTIYDSRIQSARLFHAELEKLEKRPEVFLSISGVNYYGAQNGSMLLIEGSPPGEDFLARVCVDWEAEAERMKSLGMRVATVRSGVVLSKAGGALQQMARPTRWGLAAPLGSGRQYMSWIHIDDLCGIFLHLLTDSSLAGVYNGVAPNPRKNNDFMHTLAEVLDKPFWAPRVPAAALKLALGEQAVIVLGSQRVSSEAIQDAGYTFKFPYLRTALQDLLR